MAEYMYLIWLGVIVVAAVVELLTMDMTSIWLAVGGIVALVLSFIPNVGWEIQLAVFVVVSALLIVFLRKITKKFLLKHTDGKTNKDLLIGQKIRVLEAAAFDHLGSAKLNDVVWSIKPVDDITVATGSIVEIVGIDGNKLLVKPVAEAEAVKDAEEKK